MRSLRGLVEPDLPQRDNIKWFNTHQVLFCVVCNTSVLHLGSLCLSRLMVHLSWAGILGSVCFSFVLSFIKHFLKIYCSQALFEALQIQIKPSNMVETAGWPLISPFPFFFSFKFKKFFVGLPWWSSGWDSLLPVQGARVRSLVRELDPTCCN